MRTIILTIVFLICISIGVFIDNAIINAAVSILAEPGDETAMYIVVEAIVISITVLPILYISSILASVAAMLAPVD